MKKKFIAVYALIGVLALGSTALTSCVDDNESASVTAIREAKAAQLNALANYQNVKAQNEQIVAQAEAAIKNAKAAAKRAQAIQDSLKAEKAKATIATDIEAAMAQAEANLIAQQVQLNSAKANLEKVLDAVDVAQKERIQNLLNAADAIMNGGKYYQTELTTDPANPAAGTYYDWEEKEIKPEQSLMGVDNTNPSAPKQVGLKYQLLEKQSEKVAAEYDLVDIQLEIEENVRQAQITLAEQQALLAEYEKYSNTDREAAKKAAQEADAKLTALQVEKEEAEGLYKQEATKIATANTNIGKTEVEKFFAQAENNKYQYGNDAVIEREYRDKETVLVTFDDGTVAEEYTDYTWNGEYYIYDGTGSVPQPETAYQEITVDAQALADLVEDAKNDVTAEEDALDNAEKDLTDAQKDNAPVSIGIYTTYKEACDARDKALKDEDFSTYEYLRDQIQSYLSTYESAVTSAEETLEGAKEEQERVTALNTLLTGDAFKTYQAVYGEYIDAVDASMEKKVELTKATHNYSVQSSLVTTLEQVANGYTDWAAKVNETKDLINAEEKKIAQMTADDGTTTEAMKQIIIDNLDAEIAALEKQIEVLEAQYDSYMQQVEELIKADDTTTTPDAPATDTPAEGEETPAA